MKGLARVVVTSLSLLVGVSGAVADEAGPAADGAVRADTDTDLGAVAVAVPVSLAMRGELVSSHPVDAEGATLSVAPGLLAQARLGLTLDGRGRLAELGLRVELEGDLRGTPGEPDVEVARFGYARGVDAELRKALLRVSATRWLHVAAGAMTSHWGLGLVANDGAHGWAPGGAAFADPVGGDRVLRASLALGPALRLGGLRGLLAVDRVLGDDVLVDGDRAYQAIGALRAGAEDRATAGLYVARRHQESPDDGRLDVWAIDVAAKLVLRAGQPVVVTLEAEAVAVTGSTTFAPTLELAEHQVAQLGAALRATAAGPRTGAVLDVLFASGDRNLYDDAQQAFRPDPNYELGLLLYRHVLAGQTGRGQINAADPDLVGYPAMGSERIASGGSATNTIAVFPRGVWRPATGVEAYGGPLIAFAPVPLVDPFQTRVSGSAGQNALGGDGGRYLGTELDLGVRYQRDVGGAAMTIGIEAGVLVPGNAFATTDGATLDPVWGARLLLQTRR